MEGRTERRTINVLRTYMMMQDGTDKKEVAAALGVSLRSVYRYIKLIEKANSPS